MVIRPRWPRWWRALGSWSRASFLGLVAAALLAVGLGVYIPRQVEQHMLDAQVASQEQILRALLGTRTLPVDDPGGDLEELHRFVTGSILRGDFVRVKLWSPDGEILYSDDTRLIGERFAPSEELQRAAAGATTHEVSDLSAPENRLERGLADRLLEIYLPVEHDGHVTAVWEVYRSLDDFAAHLGRVRLAVWGSVGSGLGVLFIFLASTFGTLLMAVQQRRREAEERTAELVTLLEVSRSVGSSLDRKRLATSAVGTIQRERDYHRVALMREPDDVLAVARDPSRAPCTGGGGDGCAAVRIALDSASGSLALVACRDAGSVFTQEDRALLEAAGEQIRIALDNAFLYEGLAAAQQQQRLLTGRLVSAHEDERRRIVGEIHDGLGQELHRILFGLHGCREGSAEETAEEMGRLETIVEGSVHRLRRLLEDLRPPTLEDVGLAASLHGLAERARREDGLAVEVHASGMAPEPPIPVRVAAFRIAQEALRNVAKHSGIRRATVELERDDGVFVMRVADEGHGVPAGRTDGLGTWLMRERCEELGGSLAVESGPGGTTVLARIPEEVGA